MIFYLFGNVMLFFLNAFLRGFFMIGDWMVTTYLITKVIENFLPNGPEVVGNMSLVIPVLARTFITAVAPLAQMNYTGFVQDYMTNYTVLRDEL